MREVYVWFSLKSASSRDCEIGGSKRLKSFLKLMSKNSISTVPVFRNPVDGGEYCLPASVV